MKANLTAALLVVVALGVLGAAAAFTVIAVQDDDRSPPVSSGQNRTGFVVTNRAINEIAEARETRLAEAGGHTFCVQSVELSGDGQQVFARGDEALQEKAGAAIKMAFALVVQAPEWSDAFGANDLEYALDTGCPSLPPRHLVIGPNLVEYRPHEVANRSPYYFSVFIMQPSALEEFLGSPAVREGAQECAGDRCTYGLYLTPAELECPWLVSDVLVQGLGIRETRPLVPLSEREGKGCR